MPAFNAGWRLLAHFCNVKAVSKSNLASPLALSAQAARGCRTACHGPRGGRMHEGAP